jgi:death on curing protein
MILLEDILILHEYSIKDFGGSSGIRDWGLLQSAIARPFQTFDGNDLYPTVFDKAAALCESLVMNHPFVDGNKRTGMLAMTTLLLEFGYKLIAGNDALYNLIIDVSTGEKGFDEIVEWLKENSTTV